MIVIEKLSDKIMEEIHDAKCYIKMALEYRETYPDMTHTLYNISLEEMGHMEKLHDAVRDMIEDYKNKNGEPPASMTAIYDYLHKKQIEKAAEVKTLQDMYRNS